MRDEVRENQRYTHESLTNQALGELRWLRRQPKILLLIGLIVGGWAVLHVLEPPVFRLEDLRTGFCIYIPTSSGGQIDAQRAIGTAGDAAAGLVQAGAERAPCDGSHSHEVASTFTLPDARDVTFPGGDVLAARSQASCDAAFADYVGHAVAGSRYELTVVVPTQTAWDAGRRAGACLVSNADGTFMASPARGTAG